MGFTINAAGYLHTYEAYRVPADSEVLKDGNAYVCENDGESALVLTDKAKKLMLQDRADYQTALLTQQEMVQAKHSQEAASKNSSDELKALAVFRTMSRGDIVPASDEKKLMEYNSDLYQMAKMAQALAQKANAKKHKSEWDSKEEAERQKKLDALQEESEQLSAEYPKQCKSFAKAQSAAIVEIGTGSMIDAEV